MKNLILALLLATLPLAGCKSGPPVTTHTQVMRSLNLVALSVHGALNTYGILFRAGKLTPDQIAKVREAKDKYTVAFQAALFVADFNVNAPASTQVQEAAAVINSLVATFSK